MSTKSIDRSVWWEQEREKLVAMAQQDSPLYVYDLSVVQSNFSRLKSMRAVDAVYYAVKANSNPDIIRLIASLGGGFDCVSRYELQLVRAHAPKAKVIFTPNFAPLEEYKFAFELADCMVTIDNIDLLRCHPEVFQGKEIFLRVDPDYSAGHHPYVQTAGKLAKFGTLIEDVPPFLELCRKLNIRIKGLHAHVGSGIKKPETWANCASFLFSLVPQLPDLKFFDIGGGLPVADDPEFDLGRIDESLLAVRQNFPKIQIIIEPGRFVVADAGVILSRVTQVKNKAGRLYLGLDAGMNTLIRPALYGAKHPVYNLTKFEQGLEWVVDIVGPICESADVLARDVKIQKSDEGDTFLISHCGAYGRAMASTYNSRPIAKEVVI